MHSHWGNRSYWCRTEYWNDNQRGGGAFKWGGGGGWVGGGGGGGDQACWVHSGIYLLGFRSNFKLQIFNLTDFLSCLTFLASGAPTKLISAITYELTFNVYRLMIWSHQIERYHLLMILKTWIMVKLWIIFNQYKLFIQHIHKTIFIWGEGKRQQRLDLSDFVSVNSLQISGGNYSRLPQRLKRFPSI
jgi:hypothetical protein